jgi:hypothetical protein
MSALKDYLQNPLWRHLYKQGMYKEEKINKYYYKDCSSDAVYTPQQIGSSGDYAVRMRRAYEGTRCGPDFYKVGAVVSPCETDVFVPEINRCSRRTQDPDRCARRCSEF